MDYRLGRILKEFRLEKGLTRKEVAEQVGVSTNTIGNYERGVSLPNIYMIDDLAEIFDMDAWELVKEIFDE